VINSNLGPISHRLATIYPLHTDRQTHNNPCHRCLEHSCNTSKTRKNASIYLNNLIIYTRLSQWVHQ